MFVDSHCHLDMADFSGRMDQVLANMRQQQVTHALCVSVTMARFPAMLRLVEQHANLFASVGVHPDTQDEPEVDLACLLNLAQHPKVVAIGETGLDFYRLEGDLTWQKERFRTHIRAAKQAAKPLIVHTRSAAEETLQILREEGADTVGGVMHCFTESWEIAQAALDLGFYISFSGIVTFKNAKALKQVAGQVPLDRILIETDAPYLAPTPHRGQVNEPAYVVHVAEELAGLRNLSLAQVAELTTNNFFRLFKQAASV